MAASGWRRGDVPGWALALGIVLVAAVALGLASLGAGGIAATAVLLLAVIGLFRLFVAVDVPAHQQSADPGADSRTEPTDQPG